MVSQPATIVTNSVNVPAAAMTGPVATDSISTVTPDGDKTTAASV